MTMRNKIFINIIDTNRYEAWILKLEKDLESLKNENKQLKEDKLLLEKRVEFLETENWNHIFEIKWVWSSKQNIEELLSEHIQ